MVETPSKNSSQYILSFAQSKEIASNTNISILDQNDKLLFTINLLKPAQSLIISILKFSLNETYRIYGGESELASFNVNGIITQVGSSTSSRLCGGMSPHH